MSKYWIAFFTRLLTVVFVLTIIFIEHDLHNIVKLLTPPKDTVGVTDFFYHSRLPDTTIGGTDYYRVIQ